MPGVIVTFGDAAPAAGAPTDTGQFFVAGLTERGVAGVPKRVTSLSSFKSQFGSRQTDSVLYDAVETAFREGATAIYVSRVVGPSPVTSSVDFTGAAGAPSIRVSAKGPGSYGNDLRVAVISGVSGGFRLEVTKVGTTGAIETSPDLADVPAAVAYSQRSSNINVTATGTVIPSNAAATALTGGADDRANITNAQWTAALDAFSPELGPGQVSFPGQSSAALHGALMAHARDHNRVALLDTPNSTAIATLTAAAAGARAQGNGEYGAMFGPWVSVPGVVPGTTRTVPYSAVQAGLIARADRYFNAGRAVAGHEFRLRYAISVPEYSKADIEAATDAGLNLAKNVHGTLQTYGFRSVIDPAVNADWVQFNYARLRMAITARLESVAQHFVFSQIDGAGHTLLGFKDALSGVLTDFYAQGALYGSTAEEAFRVDVGESVNTPETISAGELHAVVGVRMSPFAEMVYIEVAKIPVTQAV